MKIGIDKLDDQNRNSPNFYQGNSKRMSTQSDLAKTMTPVGRHRNSYLDLINQDRYTYNEDNADIYK